MKQVPKLTIQMVATAFREVPFAANIRILIDHGYDPVISLSQRRIGRMKTFFEYLQDKGRLGALYSDLLKLAKK